MENRFGGLLFNHAPCFSGEDSKAEEAVRGKQEVKQEMTLFPRTSVALLG
jgi:hypothetical protein